MFVFGGGGGGEFYLEGGWVGDGKRGRCWERGEGCIYGLAFGVSRNDEGSGWRSMRARCIGQRMVGHKPAVTYVY